MDSQLVKEKHGKFKKKIHVWNSIMDHFHHDNQLAVGFFLGGGEIENDRSCHVKDGHYNHLAKLKIFHQPRTALK